MDADDDDGDSDEDMRVCGTSHCAKSEASLIDRAADGGRELVRDGAATATTTAVETAETEADGDDDEAPIDLIIVPTIHGIHIFSII
jgi:hypothetical protein